MSPLYEFWCHLCGKFEMSKAMEQRYYARCPNCNSVAPKLMSSGSFVMGKRDELYQGPRKQSERLM